MTTTDKLRDVREALYIAWQDRREIGETGEVFIRAIARLTALEKEREWQSIESAPRDGTPILAYVAGRCYGDTWCDVVFYSDTTDRWFSGNSPIKPTHWMQLPAPPTIASCKRGDGDE